MTNNESTPLSEEEMEAVAGGWEEPDSVPDTSSSPRVQSAMSGPAGQTDWNYRGNAQGSSAQELS
ncbi:MAG: hypothetical protein OXF65_02920 [Acidimicrobiaceae bacterium]|nr:hypothetical protein [Acidimicrobiaceae bacterium]